MIMFSFGFAETLEIYYNSNAHIYGFQFNVDSVIVKSASGGDATENEFTLSTGNNTVLGFSMTGRTIPPGNYTIMYLDFSGDISTICIHGIVVADPSGNAIDTETGECWIP